MFVLRFVSTRPLIYRRCYYSIFDRNRSTIESDDDKSTITVDNKKSDDTEWLLRTFDKTDTFRDDIFYQFNPEYVRDNDDQTMTSDEDELSRIRDISRMKAWHRTIVNGRITPVIYEWQKQRKHLRARFAQYGKRSGVNPGVLWPTHDEIELQMAIAADLEPKLTATIEAARLAAKQTADRHAERIANVEANIKAYPKKLKEYYDSQANVERVKSERELKLDQRIKEVQEYFGYWIDPKDPRFEIMLKQKEAEEIKAEKLRARQEKMSKTIADAGASE